MAIDFDNLRRQIKERGKTQTLDNGVVVVSEDTHGSGLVSGRIVLRVGSAYEDHPGIMHFLEHMCYNGSRLYPDRDKMYNRAGLIGLGVNANTGDFNMQFPVYGTYSKFLLSENFEEALKIITDNAFFPRFSEETRRKEEAVIQREIEKNERAKKANPFHKSYKQTCARIWENNPILGKCGLGTSDSIAKITAEKLRDWHNKFFVSNNTIVDLLGDLNSMLRAKSSLCKILEEIPFGKETKEIEILPEKPYEGREVLVLESPMKGKVDVSIFFQTPNADSLESQCFNLINYIFTGNMGSLLYKDLRDKKGLVYSVKSSVIGHKKTGFLNLQYSVDPDKLDYSLQLIDENIGRLKKGDFSEDLISAYRAAFFPGMIYRYQNSGWIRNELYEIHSVERGEKESTGLQQLEVGLNLQKQDVVEAANKYLGENRLEVYVK